MSVDSAVSADGAVLINIPSRPAMPRLGACRPVVTDIRLNKLRHTAETAGRELYEQKLVHCSVRRPSMPCILSSRNKPASNVKC